ncbi:hypothetical protein DFJ74DRAFT_642114 [Hyaloraphidium curvatum]|nr:hypothetical protein DFJ74DRAFT_642114 [Hyaloraphidium curvatum]
MSYRVAGFATKAGRRLKEAEHFVTTEIRAVPPWSILKDPLGHLLPFYGSTRPFPPPIPLLGGETTPRLRAAGDRPHYERPRYIPFQSSASPIVDREAVVRRPADETGPGLVGERDPGDLLRTYYRRPSWVWAAVGVVGLFVGALVYRRSPFSSLGQDSAKQQRQEIRELAQIVAASKAREAHYSEAERAAAIVSTEAVVEDTGVGGNQSSLTNAADLAVTSASIGANGDSAESEDGLRVSVIPVHDVSGSEEGREGDEEKVGWVIHGGRRHRLVLGPGAANANTESSRHSAQQAAAVAYERALLGLSVYFRICFATMLALEVSGTAGSDAEVRAAGEPPGDPLLPPELFVPIMEYLGADCKATLANFMLASKNCYHLGLPVLLRHVELTSYRFDMAAAEMLRDPERFRHVRSAQIHSPRGLVFLKHAMPFLERLTVEVSDAEFSKKLFEIMLLASGKLVKLELAVWPQALFIDESTALPPSIEVLDCSFHCRDNARRFAAVLSKLDALKQWSLKTSCLQLLCLDSHPGLMDRLQSLQIPGRCLQELAALRGLKITRLRLLLMNVVPRSDAEIWETVSAIDTLRHLVLSDARTTMLAGLRHLSHPLDTLTVENPWPTVHWADFGALRESVGACRTVQAIEFRGEWRFDQFNEEGLWRSLPRVTVL